jgi:AcrR family transcriptional regulator
MTGAPTPRGRRAARTQAQRRASSERRLLRATARLIAQRGTSSVGFGEIAKAAGCSHGLPSYLFGTKAGLLQALVNDITHRYRAEVIDPAVEGTTGLDALLIALRAFLDGLDRPVPELRAVYVLLGEALGSDAELQATLNDYHATLRSSVERWIAEGIEDGQIRPSVRPDAQAVLILGMLRGIGYQFIADPFVYDLDALTVELIDSVRRSLAVEPPG